MSAINEFGMTADFSDVARAMVAVNKLSREQAADFLSNAEVVNRYTRAIEGAADGSRELARVDLKKYVAGIGEVSVSVMKNREAYNLLFTAVQGVTDAEKRLASEQAAAVAKFNKRMSDAQARFDAGRKAEAAANKKAADDKIAEAARAVAAQVEAAKKAADAQVAESKRAADAQVADANRVAAAEKKKADAGAKATGGQTKANKEAQKAAEDLAAAMQRAKASPSESADKEVRAAQKRVDILKSARDAEEESQRRQKARKADPEGAARQDAADKAATQKLKNDEAAAAKKAREDEAASLKRLKDEQKQAAKNVPTGDKRAEERAELAENRRLVAQRLIAARAAVQADPASDTAKSDLAAARKRAQFFDAVRNAQRQEDEADAARTAAKATAAGGGKGKSPPPPPPPPVPVPPPPPVPAAQSIRSFSDLRGKPGSPATGALSGVYSDLMKIKGMTDATARAFIEAAAAKDKFTKVTDPDTGNTQQELAGADLEGYVKGVGRVRVALERTAGGFQTVAQSIKIASDADLAAERAAEARATAQANRDRMEEARKKGKLTLDRLNAATAKQIADKAAQDQEDRDQRASGKKLNSKQKEAQRLGREQQKTLTDDEVAAARLASKQAEREARPARAASKKANTEAAQAAKAAEAARIAAFPSTPKGQKQAALQPLVDEIKKSVDNQFAYGRAKPDFKTSNRRGDETADEEKALRKKDRDARKKAVDSVKPTREEDLKLRAAAQRAAEIGARAGLGSAQVKKLLAGKGKDLMDNPDAVRVAAIGSKIDGMNRPVAEQKALDRAYKIARRAIFARLEADAKAAGVTVTDSDRLKAADLARVAAQTRVGTLKRPMTKGDDKRFDQFLRGKGTANYTKALGDDQDNLPLQKIGEGGVRKLVESIQKREASTPAAVNKRRADAQAQRDKDRKDRKNEVRAELATYTAEVEKVLVSRAEMLARIRNTNLTNSDRNDLKRMATSAAKQGRNAGLTSDGTVKALSGLDASGKGPAASSLGEIKSIGENGPDKLVASRVTKNEAARAKQQKSEDKLRESEFMKTAVDTLTKKLEDRLKGTGLKVDGRAKQEIAKQAQALAKAAVKDKDITPDLVQRVLTGKGTFNQDTFLKNPDILKAQQVGANGTDEIVKRLESDRARTPAGQARAEQQRIDRTDRRLADKRARDEKVLSSLMAAARQELESQLVNKANAAKVPITPTDLRDVEVEARKVAVQAKALGLDRDGVRNSLKGLGPDGSNAAPGRTANIRDTGATAVDSLIAAKVKQKEKEAAALATATEEAAKKQKAADDRVTQDQVRGTVRGKTDREAARLEALGRSMSRKGRAELDALASKIAETATKVGASAADVNDVFTKAAAGDLKGVNAQYQALVSDVVKYQERVNREREKIASGGKGGGGAPRKGTGADGFPSPSEKNLEALKSWTGGLDKAKNAVSNLVLYRGFNAITTQIGDAITKTRDLQIEISLIRTLSQDAQQTQGQFQASVMRVSNQTGIAAQDIATSFYDLASNQVAAGAAIEKTALSVAQFSKVAKATPQDAGNLVSSVLNTFGSEAGNTDEIAGKLFKVIDRGRIVASDLAGSFGRVAFNAKDVGLSFEEVGAALSTTTRAGVSSSEAMTLVTNLINKLAKPTEAGAKFLHGLGFETGRAAVEALGFTGVMEKLIEATQNGTLSQEEFFNEIRGARGFIALRQSIQGYTKDLEYLKNTKDGVYDAAIEIRDESTGAKLQKAKVQATNALMGTLGNFANNAIGGVIDFTKSQGDLTESVVKTTKVLLTAGTAITGMSLALRIAGTSSAIMDRINIRSRIVQEAMSAARVRDKGLTEAQIAAEGRLAAVRAGYGKSGVASALTRTPGAAVLGSGLVLYGVYEAYNATLSESFKGLGTTMSETAKAFDDKSLTKTLESANDAVRMTTDGVKGMNRELLKVLALDAQKLNRGLADVEAKIKSGSELLKVGFVAAVDAAGESLTKVKNRLSEIPNLIHKSIKAQIEFTDKVNDTRNDTVGSFARDDQQPEFTKARIGKLSEQITGLESEPDLTDEKTDEVRKLYDERLKLIIQYEQQVFNLKKKKYDQLLDLEVAQRQRSREAQRGGAEVSLEQKFRDDRDDEDYRRQRQLPFRPKETLDPALDKEVAQRNKFEDKVKERLKAEQELKKQEESDLTEKKAALQAAIKAYEEFSVRDGNDKVKPKYLAADGKTLDPAKAKGELEDLAKTIRDLIGDDNLKRLDFGRDVDGKQRSIDALMTDQSSLLNQQIDLLKSIDKNVAVTRKTSDDNKKADEAAKAVSEARKSEAAAFADVAAKLKSASTDLGAIRELPDALTRADRAEKAGRYGGAVGRTVTGIGTDALGWLGSAVSSGMAAMNRLMFDNGNDKNLQEMFQNKGDKQAAALAQSFAERAARVATLSDPKNFKDGKPDVEGLRKEVEGAKVDLEQARSILPEIERLIAAPSTGKENREPLEKFKLQLDAVTKFIQDLDAGIGKAEEQKGVREKAEAQVTALAANTDALLQMKNAFMLGFAQAGPQGPAGPLAAGLLQQKNQADTEAAARERAKKLTEAPAPFTAPAAQPGADPKVPAPGQKAFNPRVQSGLEVAPPPDQVAQNVSTTTYGPMTININGSDADPQEIASMVVRQIKRNERLGSA